jgi:acyl-CoA synthetase (NDP forming)
VTSVTGVTGVTGASGGQELTGIEAFFEPRCVAVVGASRRPGKLGHDVLQAAADRGFTGRMYGVNPRRDDETSEQQVAGWPMLRSLSEIDEPIDLALVAVPAAATLGVVSECAKAGVRAAVLAAAGLGEVDAAGRAIEAEIGRVAASGGVRLLGPNGFGLFVAASRLNLTTWPDIPIGGVALLTQSGNVAIALFAAAARAGVGFSSCAGLGNQLDVDLAALVSYHAGSERCDAIAVYVEGVATGSGRRLRDALLRCRDAGKPVVVLKGGRSLAGASAAMTHTGALGGDDRVWDAVLAETGALRIDSAEEMVDLLAAVTLIKPSAGRTLILTDGGGDSVLSLDALAAAGIPLARLTRNTEAALDAVTPPAAPRVPGRNPVTLDTAGGLEDDPALIARCAQIGAADPGVDVIVVSGTFGGYRAQRVAELAGVDQLVALHRSGTPVVVHSAFAAAVSADGDEPVERLRENGIPVYPSVRRLARALAAVTVGAPGQIDNKTEGEPNGDGARLVVLSAEAAAARLRAVGAEVPPMAVVAEPNALAAAAATIGFPVCLKVEDPGVTHKSDVGGVRLNVSSDDLASTAAELWARFPSASVLVMPMLAPGVELLVGAAQDPTFGAFVTVGRGGVTTELDPDVAVLLAPVTVEAARAAWLSLRCGALLQGWRGARGVDIEAIAKLAASLSQLAASDPTISIECNPVIAHPDGYGIADLRAVVAG